MKKYILFCFALLLHLYINSQALNDSINHSQALKKEELIREQYRQKQIEDVTNNAEFIFEGIILKSARYPRRDNTGSNYCAISNLIKRIPRSSATG